MKHAVQHLTVLGSAIVIAAGIILVAGSRGEAPPSRPAPPGDAPRGTSRVGGAKPGRASAAAPAPVEESDLETAERHFRAAAELYSAAAGHDDAQESLKIARRRLDEAQRILRELPEDAPGVKAMRLKVQELLQNVIKDSGL